METSIRRTAKIVCYCIAISFFSACSYKDHIDYINQKAAAERFYADGKYSESIDAYSKALEYVRKVDDPVLQVMILGDMAKVLEKNGEKARAEDLLKERIEIARNRVLDVETRTHTYYALATFYVVNDQCEKATRAVEELKRDEAGKNSSSKETVELLDDILKLRCTNLDGADRNTAVRNKLELAA